MFVYKIKLSPYIVDDVIDTRVCSVARLRLTIVTHLEQWEVFDTRAIVEWRT